jgi:hypothetical protein
VSETEGSKKRVAETMTEWFREVLRLCDQVFFGVSTDERQRKAAIMNTLARNAKILVESDIDEAGEIFMPLCLVLSAACRRLDVEPGAGQWRAAVENVLRLKRQLRAEERSLASLGLSQMTSAAVFKEHLDEALVNAGALSHADLEAARLQFAAAGV